MYTWSRVSELLVEVRRGEPSGNFRDNGAYITQKLLEVLASSIQVQMALVLSIMLHLHNGACTTHQDQ